MKNKIFFVYFFFISFLISRDFSFDDLDLDENTKKKVQKGNKSLRQKSRLSLLQNHKENFGVTNNTLIEKTKKNVPVNSNNYSSNYDDLDSYDLDSLFGNEDDWMNYYDS